MWADVLLRWLDPKGQPLSGFKDEVFWGGGGAWMNRTEKNEGAPVTLWSVPPRPSISLAMGMLTVYVTEGEAGKGGRGGGLEGQRS